MKKKRKKALLISAAILLLAIPLLILPTVSAIIYESIFGSRYETAPWMIFSVEDYEGLTVENCQIPSDGGNLLAGYRYEKAEIEETGVVVLAHGLGGGGQNAYMPIADAFTSGGYYVFAYDATGCDFSTGDSVEGLPQGIKDLDTVLRYLREEALYGDLPIFLFGHSWGAYSVGSVLNLHPEVRAAVMISGFDRSEDMILQQGETLLGEAVTLFSPYVTFYETLKFGKFASLSALSGIGSTDASILIIHSMDDTTVLPQNGYDKFYAAFDDSDRVEFLSYNDRGHSYLFYSDAAKVYREKLNADYTAYVEANGGEYTAEIKTEFMEAYLDKKQCFEPDPELMERILTLFSSCENN